MNKLNRDEPKICLDFRQFSTRPDLGVLAFNAAKLTCDAKVIIYNTNGLTLYLSIDEENTAKRLCQLFGLLTYKRIYDDYSQIVNVVTILNTTNFLDGEKIYV